MRLQRIGRYVVGGLLAAAMAWAPGLSNAAPIIDFSDGGVGGGTLVYDGTNVVGSNVVITKLLVVGAPTANGTYDVQNGMLNFNTAANSLMLTGHINALGITSDVNLISNGHFTSYTWMSGHGFMGAGPDSKYAGLLTAVGLPTNTPFAFFGFAIGGVGSDRMVNVTSTDIKNTAVPEPASILLLGSGLVGVGSWMCQRRKDA